MPSMRLDGRRALVTGGSRGIGFAAACTLAELGADVTLAARSLADVEAASALLRESGWTASSLSLDVMDAEATCKSLSALEPFDVLVNNAGTNRPKPITHTTPADFDAVMNLNLRGAYFVAKAIAAGMSEVGRGGSIINISSQMGYVGSPNRTLYCASKHAIEGLTKSLAVELGGAGIRVNSICPTFILTDMTRPFFEDEAFSADVRSKIVLGRLGELEDVMGAIAFLAGDASGLVTGSAIMVDGGWTAA